MYGELEECLLSASSRRLSAKCREVHSEPRYLALLGSPWPSAARARGKGSCLRLAGSSSGRLHCSQAGGPRHRLCHSWRWENFPESGAETQETVDERKALCEGVFSVLAFLKEKWFGEE